MIVAAIFTWFKKSNSSLPTLYFKICSKRGGELKVRNFRQLEKNGAKVIKLILDEKYLLSCLELRICPDFLKFKKPKLSVYNNSHNLYQSVLNKKLLEIKQELRLAQNSYRLSKEVFKKLTFLEKNCLISLLSEQFKKLATETIKRHHTKLINLWKKQRHSSPECLKNLSSKQLSIKEEEALRFGLGHHIPPPKIRTDSVKLSIERLVYSLKKNTGISPDQDFKDKVKFNFCKFIHQANNFCASRSNKSIHKSLKLLANNNDIKVCRFDKGNGVVLLNSCDYLSKLDDIVNDQTKFMQIPIDKKQHPIKTKEKSIEYYIRKYFKNYGKETINELIPSGSNPGKLYGLIKTHKPNNPCRPVVSMIGTPEYKLAKFLDSIIKPHIPNTYLLNSTSDFVNNVRQFQFDRSHKLVSFDVSSLFTNVPLSETIKIIADDIYAKDDSLHPLFSKQIFIKLLHLATEGMFLHRDILFKQIDGVAMGSPLGPTLANYFMGSLEQTIFKTAESCHPVLYLRYVDDVFAVFSDNNDIDNFLKILNSQHRNIKFTCEKALTSIAFLDVEIKVNGDGSADTWVWRKSTNTNLLLNFCAFCPSKWKSDLILCLLHRARIICSSNSLFLQEVAKLRKIFFSNGYSIQYFNEAFSLFQCKDKKKLNNSTLDSISSYFIKLPYVKKHSQRFYKQLFRLVFCKFNVKISPVYCTFKVGNIFHLKDKTPFPLCSNVVYQFSCSCDENVSYIGMTSRHLITRVKEHLNLGDLHTKSAIKDHIYQCKICSNSNYSINSFRILRQCNNDYDTKIHEALIIKRKKPELNKQLFANGASFLLNVF